MDFNNKESEKVTLPDGRVIFISRSPSVVGCFVFQDSTTMKLYTARVKRGKGVPDFQGHWCLPCGYLDWNESGTEGTVRELYEETGMNIYEVSAFHDLLCDSYENKKRKVSVQLMQPFHVNHYPDANKQNVSLHFGANITLKERPSDALFDDSVVDKGESEEAIFQEINLALTPLGFLPEFERWFSYQSESFKEKTFAFGHDKLIYEFLKRSGLARPL